MIDKIELFGKEINLKMHDCSLFGAENRELSPYINLYVRTKFCNAKCKFCTYAEDASKFNEQRFIEALKEITSKIHIAKIAISGGEPTLYWDNFKTIATLSKEYAPNNEMTMTTDGLRLEQLFNDPIYKLFDTIQLSRHHYDDEKNNEIFVTKTPSTEEIKNILKLRTHKHQVQFRCNLIKGYIDNKEEIFKYLDWVNDVGINDVGIVSLMPINEYSKENYIYFHIKELIGENFMLTKKWERHKGGCECFNYVYVPSEEKFTNTIRVYHKNTYAPSIINDTLVFDGYNIKLGFDGETIF